MNKQTLADEVARRTLTVLDRLPDSARTTVGRPHVSDAVRRISFRPHPRPGARLGDIPRAARQALYQLLDFVLSDQTFAQVGMIMGEETWISRSSQWEKDQQPDDYFFVLFGDPGSPTKWSWRLEGHHVSITATVTAGHVTLAPVFLGASPATYTHRGAVLFSPLAAETDLARAAITAMGPDDRALARVSPEAPREIRFGSAPSVPAMDAVGVPIAQLPVAPRQLIEQLVEVYLSRAAPPLAERQRHRLKEVPGYFAWFGGGSLGRNATTCCRSATCC